MQLPRGALRGEDVLAELLEDAVGLGVLGEVLAALGDLADELGVVGEEDRGEGGDDEEGRAAEGSMVVRVGPVGGEEAGLSAWA